MFDQAKLASAKIQKQAFALIELGLAIKPTIMLRGSSSAFFPHP